MTLQPELPFVTQRNHYLFSDYYLAHRVAERQEWTDGGGDRCGGREMTGLVDR